MFYDESDVLSCNLHLYKENERRRQTHHMVTLIVISELMTQAYNIIENISKTML